MYDVQTPWTRIKSTHDSLPCAGALAVEHGAPGPEGLSGCQRRQGTRRPPALSTAAAPKAAGSRPRLCQHGADSNQRRACRRAKANKSLGCPRMRIPGTPRVLRVSMSRTKRPMAAQLPSRSPRRSARASRLDAAQRERVSQVRSALARCPLEATPSSGSIGVWRRCLDVLSRMMHCWVCLTSRDSRLAIIIHSHAAKTGDCS